MADISLEMALFGGREREEEGMGTEEGRNGGVLESFHLRFALSESHGYDGMREEKEGRKEGWKGAMVDYSDARMSQTHMLPACPWLTKLDFLD